MSNQINECALSLDTWTNRRADNKKIPNQKIIWQTAIRNIALLNCLNYMEDILKVPFDENYKVLDVGSASGYGLVHFFLANFKSHQLYGIDLFPDRIELGKKTYPGINFIQGNGIEMLYDDNFFELTMEQFCFVHIMDDDIRVKTAKEMIRVTKPGGHIIIFDWLIGNKKRQYNGVSKKKIINLFDIGRKTKIMKRFPGQIFPGIGRIISLYCPSLYPLCRTLFPFTVLSKITLLQKLS